MMRRRQHRKYIAGIAAVIIVAAMGLHVPAAALTQEELQEQIRAQNERLETINKELEQTQNQLEEVQGQRTSLQRELSSIDYSVRKLDLNIRAGEITTQKLSFEIDSLQYDLRSIELSVDDKKEALVDLLREIQKNDQTNLLIILLEHKSLADSLTEARSLGNVRAQLDVDIANLTQLSNLYQQKLDEVTGKKTQTDVEQRNLQNRKIILEDTKEQRQVLLRETRSQESIYEQKIEKLKEQQQAISDEISKIEDQLRAAFDPGLLPTKRPGVFAWPVQNIRITQHFGERSHLYRGKPHNGLDLGIPVGTPIFAAEAGEVIAVGNNDRSSWQKYQYGKYVLIRHDNNLATLYAHLSRQVVDERQVVGRGDLIGYAGNTGYATGPHLHFGVYWAPSILMKSIPPAAGLVPVGVIIDPEDYL